MRRRGCFQRGPTRRHMPGCGCCCCNTAVGCAMSEHAGVISVRFACRLGWCYISGWCCISPWVNRGALDSAAKHLGASRRLACHAPFSLAAGRQACLPEATRPHLPLLSFLSPRPHLPLFSFLSPLFPSPTSLFSLLSFLYLFRRCATRCWRAGAATCRGSCRRRRRWRGCPRPTRPTGWLPTTFCTVGGLFPVCSGGLSTNVYHMYAPGSAQTCIICKERCNPLGHGVGYRTRCAVAGMGLGSGRRGAAGRRLCGPLRQARNNPCARPEPGPDSLACFQLIGCHSCLLQRWDT